MTELLLATGNQNKCREYARMLAPLEIQVVSQKEAGVFAQVEETGSSFEENAYIKAKALYDATGKPAVADDSGLEVTALHGAPGIYSARYAGENADDFERNQKLLKELDGENDRSAQFVCVICYINKDGEPFYARGVCKGTIAKTAVGNDGFGYDPIFLVGAKTFAQLSGEEKDQISHRGNALRAFLEFLKKEKEDDQ